MASRSIPSRQTLLDLAQALDVPLRERNELLTAAGYAPLYPDQALDAPAMNSINKALQRMLRQHEPFPAIVLDRYWNVLMANDAAPRLFNCFVDLDARPTPRNLLHLMFDPKGLRPFVVNWPETARGLLGRLSREALGHVIDEKTRAIFGRSYAAEPDVLVKQLANDEAIQAADTLLLTVPNQLGVDYNAHVLGNILTHVAPELGWR